MYSNIKWVIIKVTVIWVEQQEDYDDDNGGDDDASETLVYFKTLFKQLRWNVHGMSHFKVEKVQHYY